MEIIAIVSFVIYNIFLIRELILTRERLDKLEHDNASWQLWAKDVNHKLYQIWEKV